MLKYCECSAVVINHSVVITVGMLLQWCPAVYGICDEVHKSSQVVRHSSVSQCMIHTANFITWCRLFGAVRHLLSGSLYKMRLDCMHVHTVCES